MAITMAARWRGRPGAESEVREALQQVEDPTASMTYFSFQGEDGRQFRRSTEW